MCINESEIFNQMADYYDEHRPGYPGEIINTIIAKANLSAGSRLLEIGSGSGKATAQFASLGYEIRCIEPGAELVKKGEMRFKDENIKFVVSRFENYTAPFEYFDVIISAQAFHWVPQPIGYEKCAHALKKGGYLAPFWNLDVTLDNDLDRELMAIVDKYGAVACIPKTKYGKRMETISSGIVKSGLFTAPEIIHAYWDKKYTAQEYNSYLSTGNAFFPKSEKEKLACYEEIKQLAAKNDGFIQRHYTCELYLARKI